MIDLGSCRSVLVYGGSFDPPHNAHVVLPPLAMRAIGADALAYIPVGRQPFKGDVGITSAEHRVAMLRLAVEGIPEAAVLLDEIERAAAVTTDAEPAPSYTVETLEALRVRLGDRVRLRLLMGGDSLRQLRTWRRPERIIELAEPVVMVRPPDTHESLLANLPGQWDVTAWRGRLIELPRIDISSSAIRDRVSRGLPISSLAPPGVDKYIREHGLYRQMG